MNQDPLSTKIDHAWVWVLYGLVAFVLLMAFSRSFEARWERAVFRCGAVAFVLFAGKQYRKSKIS